MATMIAEKAEFADVILLVKTADIGLYPDPFVLLGIATRLVAKYYLKVSHPQLSRRKTRIFTHCCSVAGWCI